MTDDDTYRKSIKLDYADKDDSLGWRAIKGGMLAFGYKVAHRGLDIARTIILARLLLPSDFGIFGIAVLAMSALETFSLTGFEQAIIQKKGKIEGYLDTAWTTRILRSFLLFSVLFFGAPLIAAFFNVSQAISVIRAVAFLNLLRGFENIGTVCFQKELRFKKIYIIGFSSLIVSAAVSISLAFILRNVWALVYGSLSRFFVTLVMSYILSAYRPKLRFDFEKGKELLNYGRWLFGSSILVFLITQGDDAFVGKMLGVAALGFYQMAYRLSNAPATEISLVVSNIVFPAYSKMQDNIQWLRESYLKVLKLVSFLSFPIVGFIIVLAPEFTRLFLGGKWMPMVPAMQALAFWGLMRSIEAVTAQLFYAIGKPKVMTKLHLLQLVLIVIFIYPLTMRIGILGTALTIVFATLIPDLIAYRKAIGITGSSIYDFGKTLFLPFANTMITVAVILVLKIWLKANIMFFVHLLAGILVYICVANIFNRFLNYDIWFVLRRIKAELKA